LCRRPGWRRLQYVHTFCIFWSFAFSSAFHEQELMSSPLCNFSHLLSCFLVCCPSNISDAQFFTCLYCLFAHLLLFFAVIYCFQYFHHLSKSFFMLYLIYLEITDLLILYLFNNCIICIWSKSVTTSMVAVLLYTDFIVFPVFGSFLCS